VSLPSTLEPFRTESRIEPETWEKAGISWDDLRAIGEDHEAQTPHLDQVAAFFGQIIQGFAAVHSVRWRVKDTAHLLEKIVRKRAAGNDKYRQVSAANYFETVTDLVGVRALHLFKEDCFPIDKAIRGQWETVETPVAYLRKGDPEDLRQKYSDAKFDVKEHPAGYRSVHYVLVTKPMRRPIFVEVQVRTIFEEGWSEIDHRVRYPNFSDDRLVGYFLEIFNRLAGSADEMGSYVQCLTTELGLRKAERESAFKALNETIEELGQTKEKGAQMEKVVAELKQRVDKLQKVGDTTPSGLGLTGIGGLFLRPLAEAQAHVLQSAFANLQLAPSLGGAVSLGPSFARLAADSHPGAASILAGITPHKTPAKPEPEKSE
jgi:putative GTP pyrophosphokinase